MNYLVAVDTFFPDRPSGSARVAWDIAQAVRGWGHNVAVFCRKQSPNADEIAEQQGIMVVRFAFPKTSSLDPFKVKKQKRAALSAVRKYLVDTHWDLIHIHTPLFGNIVYEVFKDKPRYVYTVHSPVVMEQEINWAAQGIAGEIKLLFGKGWLRKLEGGLLHRVDGIQTLSEFTKNAVDKYYGVGDKVTIIPHWCRGDFFRRYTKTDARSRLGWPKTAKILFTVRRLAPRMGIDIAIKAAAPLLKTQPAFYFAIAGAGPLERPLRQLAESLDVADRIWFLGRISDDDLKSCYEAADLFVLPTRALECFGLIILEAFAYGLPIISSDAGAIPELMNPVLPHCVVSAGKVGALREKLSQWIDGRLDLPASEILVDYVSRKFERAVISEKLKAFLNLNVAAR